MVFDYERIARELVRALRGKRSQTAMSRLLGFQTNVAYAWESGRSYPSGAAFLAAAQRVGIDVREALLAFYRTQPAWLMDVADPTTPAAVAMLLSDLHAGRPIVELAHSVGRSRFAVARILRGDTEPRLPDFLRLVHGASMRLLDFVGVFVEVGALPSVADAALRLEASRRLAYEAPFAHAVLRVLELTSYRALPSHRDEFVAERLDITLDEARGYLALLHECGQIALQNGRFVPTDVMAVDTRKDPAQALALRRFWTETALARAGRREDDVFAFNLGTVSEADMERVRELHRQYYAELRAIVGASEPAQAVLLANVVLVRMA